MNISPIACAAVLSCAIHIGAFTTFVHSNPPLESTKEITFSSTLQATLIQETQDAGETIKPAVVPIETVETKQMDKHVHELISAATLERDQVKSATKSLQTSLARAARDNLSLAKDHAEPQTKNRLLTKHLTELTSIKKESDQAVADKDAQTEKPRSDLHIASTLNTRLASRRVTETGNTAVNHNPRPVAGNPKPDYPILARNQGIEGRVVVNVLISAQGTVKSIGVGQTSGSRLLDKAAVQAVKQWRFHPALYNGKAIPSSETVPIVFKLKDS